MPNTPPFTGSVVYDAPIAILFLFFGIWITVRYGNRIGWLIIAVSVVWGYYLFRAY